MNDNQRDIRHVGDLLEVSKEFASPPRELAWWRGHSFFDWQLAPKVFRPGLSGTAELNLFLKFKAYARTRHPLCPDDEDLPSWFTLAQHYGLPTRLLDWTESILVAAYFATEDTNRDGAVWLLQPALLNKLYVNAPGLLIPSHEIATALLDDVRLRHISGSAAERAVAVIFDEIDPRMLVQHSRFTLHGSRTPLEQLLSESDNRFLWKFRVPKDVKKRLARELSLLGIQRSTLFPDLESLASDLVDYEKSVVPR